MKKLLALVLALVMTLGLATVGTNAATWSDLKDTDKVAADREEAFKVLNSIQIFEGDENNNLNPDAQLTRAEAAKIIATLNLGKTAADNLSGNGGKFSDVPASNWASGYIEYCASTGIIAGRGDGTFDPAGSLTFAAFSKMLLVSLGYVAEVEELVGGEWEFNVARIATTIDLYKGMDTPASKEIVKRADAAQMAFNVLKTPMVTYAYNGTNLLTNISAVGKTAAVYETTAARDTQTISTATVNDGSARGTYMVEFAERHFPKLTRNSHDTDDWGRPCTTWTLNREVVGSFVNSDIVVFTTTENVKGSEIYKALGGATLLSRYANDLTRSGAYFDIYVDGVELTEKTTPTYSSVYNRIKDQGSWMSKLNAANGIRVAGAGTELTVYLDEDSYYNYGVVTNDTAKVPVVTIVVRNTWLAEVNADYDTVNKNLLLGVYTADDAPETHKAATSKVSADLTGYKEGNWVLVKMTRDDGVVREVSDPEIVKGAYINAYTVEDGMSTITVDSKDEYGVAATAHTDATILNQYQLRELQGFTYDLYTDGKADHLYGIQYASRDTDLVFVVGYQKDSTALAATTVKTNLIFMDGSMATKTVSLATNGSARTYFTAAGAKDQVLNAWFTYAKDESGNITLRDMIPSSNTMGAAVGDTSDLKKYPMHQYSVVLDPAYNNDTIDVDSNHTTMEYVDGNAPANTLYAIGSDNSVYIAAVADDTVNDNGVGAISRVNGVTKGIKNTSLIGIDTDAFKDATNTTVPLTGFTNKATSTVGGSNKSNAYFVFDANRYVVAAVVLTANTAADHLMYVIDDGNVNGINKREFISGVGYVDHYTAIIDGKTELVDVKVDSLRTNTDTNKLDLDTLYAIAYDSTGEYVIVANKANNTPNQLTNTANKQRGFAEYQNAIKNGTKITLGDQANKRNTNMLYVKDALDNNVGYIATAATGNFWVYRPDSDTWTRYNTASAAVAAATVDDAKGNSYSIDSVYAMCDKGTGYAGTMAFIAAKDGVKVAGTTTGGGTGAGSANAYTGTFPTTSSLPVTAGTVVTSASSAVYSATDGKIYLKNVSMSAATVAEEELELTITETPSGKTSFVKVTLTNGTDDTPALADGAYAIDFGARDDTKGITITKGTATVKKALASVALVTTPTDAKAADLTVDNAAYEATAAAGAASNSTDEIKFTIAKPEGAKTWTYTLNGYTAANWTSLTDNIGSTITATTFTSAATDKDSVTITGKVKATATPDALKVDTTAVTYPIAVTVNSGAYSTTNGIAVVSAVETAVTKGATDTDLSLTFTGTPNATYNRIHVEYTENGTAKTADLALTANANQSVDLPIAAVAKETTVVVKKVELQSQVTITGTIAGGATQMTALDTATDGITGVDWASGDWLTVGKAYGVKVAVKATTGNGVKVTLADAGNGAFSSTTVDLKDPTLSGTVTYTPAIGGTPGISGSGANIA